ncbi:MAG: DUF2891 domain-containing protein [Planctomycetaceae bacterium]
MMSHAQDSRPLTEQQVVAFAELALKGIPQEYPNKPSNVMQTADDVRSPREMHPAFYGNFDWHSAVHGHWMLIRLLRLSPESSVAGSIRDTLNRQLTLANMQAEAEYFKPGHNRSFERMYGWAWLLQLVRELHTWDDSDAKQWRRNLKPLEEVIRQSAFDYLPKLSFPIRVGTHTDTGFALSMLLDYSRVVEDSELESLVVQKAKQFYLKDKIYPAHYEPSGHDFFSSGFNEADLMRRVLPQKEFAKWLDQFLPQLNVGTMGSMMTPVEVPDVTDGHLVHLAGLDLSRAWTMQGIADALPADDPRRNALGNAVAAHAELGLTYVTSGHYEGEHWLATFAVYHLTGSGLEVKPTANAALSQ